MKKTVITPILTWLLVVSSFIVNAQRATSQGQTTMQLLLEKNNTPVENMTFTDILGADNRIQHTANFDLLLTNDAATRSILQQLQVLTKERVGRTLSFITFNQLGEPIQERVYENTMIEDIIFPALDATMASTSVRATVKLRAGNVITRKEGPRLTAKLNKGLAYTSNFSITVGGLPTTRVALIRGLSIKPGNTQPISLTIELSAQDGNAWNQWFLTGAGGIKKEQGNIRLLSPNFKDVLYDFSLMDVEIISFSQTSGPRPASNRAIVGLRIKGIAIK